MSKSTHQSIPTRRVILSDASQMPQDYSSTPGGSIFSTTPGGTRIIYDRAFLMQCRNSPLAKSPPPNLPKIPGITCEGNPKDPISNFKEVDETIIEEKEPQTLKGLNNAIIFSDLTFVFNRRATI